VPKYLEHFFLDRKERILKERQRLVRATITLGNIPQAMAKKRHASTAPLHDFVCGV
jgi:hypothetical protein